MNLIENLSGTALFRHFGEEAIERILPVLTFSHYTEDDVIVNGSFMEFKQVYIILDGEVRIVFFDEELEKMSYFDLKSGDFFGEYNLFFSTQRNYIAVAKKPCGIGLISFNNFKSLMTDKVISQNMIHHLYEKMENNIVY